MKRFMLCAASVAMGALLCACSSNKSMMDIDTDKYVTTLGQYTGLDIEATAPYVNESQVESDMESRIVFFADKVAIKDRACVEKDKVNINYCGKIDGVAFEGGTAEDQTLVVGDGMYIPGFEEGIVGMNPGETKDVEVTFPTDYNATDLAGKKAVFSITLNYILPELTDEVVAKFEKEEYSNVSELHDYIYNMYYEQAQADAKQENVGRIIYNVVENSTFAELPQNLIDEEKASINSSLEMTCQSYGITVDDYLKQFYGMTASEMAEKYVKQRMILLAIAKAEKLEVSDATVQSSLETAAAAQSQTVDEYLEAQNVTKDYLKEYMTSQLVYDFVYGNNNLIEEEQKNSD